MLEHLRREHWGRPLWGLLRPAALILSFPMLFVHGDSSVRFWSLAVCAALAFLSALQLLLSKRQPMPAWTSKAILLVSGAVTIDVLLLALFQDLSATVLSFGAVALPFCQSIILGIVAFIFLPVDRKLKSRILDRAKVLRAAHPEVLVIGVTGSVGKTTVKELLGHVLAVKGGVATPAHVNTELGVAQWLTNTLSKKDVPPIVVLEMGAYKRGEIALLTDVSKPNIGIVTAVGTQHLALFGSAENIWRAKSELIQSLPVDGHAFLNGDDEGPRRMKDVAACPVTLVGTGGSADIEAMEIEETAKGLQFRVGQTMFTVALRGTHNVTNVLLAIAVARYLGIDDKSIVQRLESFTPPSNTFQVRQIRKTEVLDDTYNSSPQSFKAAIGWAKSQPFDHKTLLAAGLIELGEISEATHRELGAASQNVFSRVIFLDDESAKAFGAGLGKPVEVLTKETVRIEPNGMLVCVGRMSPETINRLLPKES